MPFWLDLSTGQYKEVVVIRNWQDLGRRFVQGQIVYVEILKGSEFYRSGLHVIPTNHCRDLIQTGGNHE